MRPHAISAHHGRCEAERYLQPIRPEARPLDSKVEDSGAGAPDLRSPRTMRSGHRACAAVIDRNTRRKRTGARLLQDLDALGRRLSLPAEEERLERVAVVLARRPADRVECAEPAAFARLADEDGWALVVHLRSRMCGSGPLSGPLTERNASGQAIYVKAVGEVDVKHEDETGTGLFCAQTLSSESQPEHGFLSLFTQGQISLTGRGTADGTGVSGNTRAFLWKAVAFHPSFSAS